MSMKPLIWGFLTLLYGANLFATDLEKTQGTLIRINSEIISELAELPLNVFKHDPHQAKDTDSILDLNLSFDKGIGIISFTETLESYNMASVYTLEVRDYQSQELVFEKRIEGYEAKLFEVPARNLNRNGKYAMRLHVERQGANDDGSSIHFDQIYIYEKKSTDYEDIGKLYQADQVQIMALEGSGSNRTVIIRDLTPHHEDINSTYKLVVWKKWYGDIEWLGEKSFTRDEITRTKNELAIPLKSINLNPPPGQRLYMDLVVTRKSDVYLQGRKVQFIVNKTF